MDDPVKKLTDELCSLLDEATILSISSDYDLTDAQEFAAARQVLLTISKDVEAEEATGFNPSGLGIDDLVDINPSNQGASVTSGHAAESDLKSNDGLTITTESSRSKSLASAVSSKTSSQGNPDTIHVGVFDGLDDEEKEGQLSAMFVSLKPIDIKLALQKYKGDASLAIDELLNLQWLEQTGQRPKGIDGFYVSDDDVPSKKKKGRKKKKKVATAPTPQRSPSDDVPPEINLNDEVNPDQIVFISDRFNLSASEATDICRRNNASLGAAIVEMLNNYIALGLPLSSSEDLPDVEEQAKRVPWIPREFISPIFEISSSRQSALDVIDVLAEHFEKPAYLKYDVSYSLVASDLEPISVPTSPSNPKQLPKPSTRPSIVPLQQQLRAQPATLQSATVVAKNLAAAKNHSYSSASSAFKKGRSDPLFRQAASFYAERGREQALSHRQAASIEAGYIVDQNSTAADMIDLHGVTVQDGVEIAVDRVWGWWDSIRGDEDRDRKARHGFTVVTGLGRHSADGRSRLRVNVFKALVADGWKVEVLTGSYLVTGRRR
ncbi:hypothetical protein F5X99DRAFT_280066 [Biscogniauxia marginata]|nr:hypothetical protein F5X99DRAFT_280066 [Biscogniauxia marginata]